MEEKTFIQNSISSASIQNRQKHFHSSKYNSACYSEFSQHVSIKSDNIYLEGTVTNPPNSKAIIIFAHGCGSSRMSPRNLLISKIFHSIGFSTLLFDILTPQEERLDGITGEFKYNIDLISNRIIDATQWLNTMPELKDLPIGYFGSSTGACGALLADTLFKNNKIFSIVSRSGRLSLLDKETIDNIKTPTLMICGSEDREIVNINRDALSRMSHCEHKQLIVIQNASHLFSEPGCLEQVAEISKCFYLSSLNKFLHQRDQLQQHHINHQQQVSSNQQQQYHNNICPVSE
ncbi:hypothetical protein CYY_008477 [Polysphondylium violaceum]|uniref:Dienelactone hydrolase domain-containing protein n=1 Tax=Polysphondylium violaceum TaxID=133409 RepID=A0A8J4UQ53_9MYCE|nr:hypothetical protein CYY_008477 [Polysphondylium violaceum]